MRCARSTSGHRWDDRLSTADIANLERATHLRETTDGRYVPVCESCAELASVDVLEILPISAEYRRGYSDGRDTANTHTTTTADDMLADFGTLADSTLADKFTRHADRLLAMCGANSTTATTYSAGYVYGFRRGLRSAATYHRQLATANDLGELEIAI